MYKYQRDVPADLVLRDEVGTAFFVDHEMSQGDLGVVLKVHPGETTTIDGDSAWFDFHAKILTPDQHLNLTPTEAQSIADRFVTTANNDQHVRHDGLVPIVAMGRTQSSDADWHDRPFRISQSRRGRSFAELLNKKWVDASRPFDAVAEELRRRPPRYSSRIDWIASLCEVTQFLLASQHPRFDLTCCNLWVTNDGQVSLGDVGGCGWTPFAASACEESSLNAEARTNAWRLQCVELETMTERCLLAYSKHLEMSVSSIGRWDDMCRGSVDDLWKETSRIDGIKIPDLTVGYCSSVKGSSDFTDEIRDSFETTRSDLRWLREFAVETEGVDVTQVERVGSQLQAWIERKPTLFSDDIAIDLFWPILDVDYLPQLVGGVATCDEADRADPESAFPLRIHNPRDRCPKCRSLLLFELDATSEMVDVVDGSPIVICFGSRGLPCGHLFAPRLNSDH